MKIIKAPYSVEKGKALADRVINKGGGGRKEAQDESKSASWNDGESECESARGSGWREVEEERRVRGVKRWAVVVSHRSSHTTVAAVTKGTLIYPISRTLS